MQETKHKDRFEFVQYALLTLGYVALTLARYPVGWVALFSLLVFPLWVYRFPPLSVLALYPLPYILPAPCLAEEGHIRYLLIGGSLLAIWLATKEFHHPLREQAKRGWSPILVVALTGLCLAGTFAIAGIAEHHNLLTAGFDLGLFDNIFKNLVLGNGQANPMENGAVGQTHFGVHCSPIFNLLAPFYLIKKSAETLIVIQSITILTGPLALFLFARTLIEEKLALGLSLCFAFYIPLQGGLLFEFHEIPFLATFLFLFGWAMMRNQTITPAIFAALAASVKEDAALLSAVAFVIIGGWANRKKYGWILAGLSVNYFIIAKTFIINSNFADKLYNGVGAHSVGEYLSLVVAHPEFPMVSATREAAIVGLLATLVPVCLLPLTTLRGVVLIAGPYLTLYPASAAYSSIAFHYPHLLAPFLFIATLQALITYKKETKKMILFICLATAATQWDYGASFERPVKAGFSQIQLPLLQGHDSWETLGEIREIKKIITPNSILATSDRLCPHFSNRPYCYNTKYAGEDTYSKMTPCFQPEYIIVEGKDSKFTGYLLLHSYKHIKVLKRMR